MNRPTAILVSRLLAPMMLLPGLVLPVDAAAAGPVATGPNCGVTGTLAGSGPLSCIYTTVGSDLFVVPAGVTQASVNVTGARGGFYFVAGDAAHGGSPAGDITGRPGGNGGRAGGTLNLTPGQILQIDVAGRGGNGTAASRSGGMGDGPSGGLGALGGFGGSDHGVAGGPGDAGGADGGTAFNGGNGSGGGGASDVRLSAAGCAALACALADRVLVAGGGGGAGGTGGRGAAFGGAGGAGGGTAGVPGDAAPPPVGGDGGAAIDGGSAGSPGSAATATSGGTGGLNRELHLAGANPSDPRYGADGVSGTVGAGGVGGGGNLPCTGTQNPPCSGGQNATTSGGGAGGGGGGGYFGGGGGSGGGGQFGGGGGAGGGAGGGSSFAAAAVVSPVLTAGVNSPASPVNAGDGQVTITWTVPAGTGESLASTASGPVAPGGRITDTATLSGASAPSGTITFDVYGPADSTCATALATSPVTVSGNGTYFSPPFTATTAGTYHWIAGYGGDGANSAVSGSCGDGLESVTVAAPVLAAPAMATAATATAVVGDRILDTATLSGGADPTGTLIFDVYGPGDTACATSLATMPANVSGNGTVTSSGGFTPTVPGAYRWVAAYSGDPNNAAVRGSCGDPGESTFVLDKPALATTATPLSAVVNGPISDTATLSGGTTPTGTITFALYGPADPTCTTALSASTATVTGAGTYRSAAFAANTVGTYHWIATYSGDPNNTTVAGACGDPGESVQVTLPSSGAAVYVTDHDLTAAKPEISQFTVAIDGTLSSKTPAAVATATGPGPIVVSADGARAYAGGSGNTVFQFDIAPDGTLSPMTPATVAAGSFPTAIALSADERFAYVANGNDNTVSEFTVAAAGALSPQGTVATGTSPVAIALSPDGKNAYVVNRNDKTVSQYTVAADGTLSAQRTVATGTTPVAIALTPDGTSAYVVNSDDNTLRQYTVAADGTLSPKTPATVATGSFPNAIAVGADGRSLYVTDKNIGAVSQYTVAADGTLSPKIPATVATGPNPIGIARSPEGGSVYVINSGDHTLSQYSVAADGTLSAKSPATVISGQSQFAIAVGPPPPGTPTFTTLAVTPPSPAAGGSTATLTATVNPKTAGSVQFLDGAVPLGAPVALAGGAASLTTTLAPGTHSLSAVFNPTAPTAFAGSTSAPLAFTVNAKQPWCIRRCS